MKSYESPEVLILFMKIKNNHEHRMQGIMVRGFWYIYLQSLSEINRE